MITSESPQENTPEKKLFFFLKFHDRANCQREKHEKLPLVEVEVKIFMIFPGHSGVTE